MKQSLVLFTILLVFINSFLFSGELPKETKPKTLIVSGKILDKGRMNI